MIEHLSYSSISAYLACPEAWRLRYVEGIKMPATPELAFGSAFHGTVEAYLQGQGDLLGLWPAQWAKQCEQSIAWGESTPEEHANEGIRILGNPDIQAMVAKIKPAVDDQGPKIERKVELHVPGVPIPIIGYIDVQTSDGVPGDLKTSARSWGQDKAQAELQPLFYLAALNQAGKTVPNWAFRHYVFVKTKSPQAQVLEHRHKPAECVWLFEVIRRVWRAIEAEQYPMNPGGWKCNPNYCDAWMRCRGAYV